MRSECLNAKDVNATDYAWVVRENKLECYPWKPTLVNVDMSDKV